MQGDAKASDGADRSRGEQGTHLATAGRQRQSQQPDTEIREIQGKRPQQSNLHRRGAPGDGSRGAARLTWRQLIK